MATARQLTIDHLEWDTLAVIHGFVGIGAVAGGISLLTGWMSMSTAYLDGTAFSSFTIPGLALAAVVGGSSLVAAFSTWRHTDKALSISLFASLMLAGWFVVQIAQVGLISWMQPFMIALLIVQAALAFTLHTHRHQSDN